MAAAEEQHRFVGVDWNDVIDRLTAEAVMLFRGADRVLQGTGFSAEDLVVDTVTKVLEDRTVRYRKDRGPLLPFLKTVMRNDFRDLLRRASHRTTVIADAQGDVDQGDRDNGEMSLDRFPATGQEFPDTLLRERAMELASDDSTLKDYVVAVLDCGVKKPSEIADLLSTSVDDIENRRKRLQRRFAQLRPIARGARQ